RRARRRIRRGGAPPPSLLLRLRDRLEVHAPAERRAAPDLLFRRQAGALLHRADPEVEQLRIGDVRGIDGRAASGAEALGALPAAFARLHVDLRLASEPEPLALRRNDDAKRGTR